MTPREESTAAVFCMTLYGEARSEGVEGLILVGMTILNRALSPITWWGKGIKDVCLASKQFSCWNNPEHPNYLKMVSAWENRFTNEAMGQIMWIADGILLGKIIRTSIYQSVNHYLRTDHIQQTSWARGRLPLVVHKHHSFYQI